MKRCFLLICFLFLFVVPVHAESEPLDVSVVEQELDEEAREISGGLVTDGSYDLGGAIGIGSVIDFFEVCSKSFTVFVRNIFQRISDLMNDTALIFCLRKGC